MTTTAAPLPTVQPGSFLTLHYRLAGPAGDVINTFNDKPATLSLGTGELSPAMEQRLLGLAEGTRTVFDVPAGEAFGQRNPELLQRIAERTGGQHYLAADRGAVVLVGNAGARSVSETACFVDLASGALHRLATSGDPWAWDGRGALASVFKGAEVDVWEDPTPAEPDEFLGWLARQTARELPLAALMGR